MDPRRAFSESHAWADSPGVRGRFTRKFRQLVTRGWKPPTESQKQNGDYPKSAMLVCGLPVIIENPMYSARTGKSEDGKPWATRMFAPYGYLPKTTGEDGEGIDVYVGPASHAAEVHVVHQKDPKTGKPDEDKVMLGFPSADAALKAYQLHYDKPDYFGTMDTVPLGEFIEESYGVGTPLAWKHKPKYRRRGSSSMYAADHWRTQSRDKAGKWTDGGGAGGKTALPKAPKNTGKTGISTMPQLPHVQRHTGPSESFPKLPRVSWELKPSTSMPQPELFRKKGSMQSASFRQQLKATDDATQRLLPVVFKKMGIKGKATTTIGGWEGVTSPSGQIEGITDFDAMLDIASVIGNSFKQDAVLVTAFDNKNPNTVAVQLTLSGGKKMPKSQVAKLYKQIYDAAPDADKGAVIGYFEHDGSMMFVKTNDDMPEEQFTDIIAKAAEAVGVDMDLWQAKARYNLLQSDPNNSWGDWSKTHGEGYKKRLEARHRSDLFRVSQIYGRHVAQDIFRKTEGKDTPGAAASAHGGMTFSALPALPNFVGRTKKEDHCPAGTKQGGKFKPADGDCGGPSLPVLPITHAKKSGLPKLPHVRKRSDRDRVTKATRAEVKAAKEALSLKLVKATNMKLTDPGEAWGDAMESIELGRKGSPAYFIPSELPPGPRLHQSKDEDTGELLETTLVPIPDDPKRWPYWFKARMLRGQIASIPPGVSNITVPTEYPNATGIQWAGIKNTRNGKMRPVYQPDPEVAAEYSRKKFSVMLPALRKVFPVLLAKAGTKMFVNDHAAAARFIMATGVRAGNTQGKVIKPKVTASGKVIPGWTMYGGVSMQVRHLKLTRNGITVSFTGKGGKKNKRIISKDQDYDRGEWRNVAQQLAKKAQHTGRPLEGEDMEQAKLAHAAMNHPILFDPVLYHYLLQRMKAGSAADKVFQTATYNKTSDYVKSLAEKYNVPYLTLHKFRHRLASEVAEDHLTAEKMLYATPEDENDYNTWVKEAADVAADRINDTTGPVFKSYFDPNLVADLKRKAGITWEGIRKPAKKKPMLLNLIEKAPADLQAQRKAKLKLLRTANRK